MAVSLWRQSMEEFQESVAAAKPAPAGVATSAATAALGLSLLIKVLKITGKCEELVEPAQKLVIDLREVADADVEAVSAYIQKRETRGLREVPERALELVTQSAELCGKAAPHITGLIAADVMAAKALLGGSAAAIRVCIAANKK
jgi:formiminotetrahydrofolate cyclodeaminase